MKKTLSLILALTLAMALAVPAMAADYGKVTIDTLYDGELVFEAATIEKTTVKTIELGWDDDIGFVDEEGVYENTTLITVKPGSTVQGSIDAAFYELDENGNYRMVMAGIGTLKGTVDDWFSPKPIYGDLVPAIYQIEALDDNYYFIVLGDGGTASNDAPAQTPAPAETPADSAPAATTPAETPAPSAPAAPAPAPAPSAPAGSGSYTAQKYDTYGKLAVNYYGSYAYTKALQQANGNKTLKEGAAVVLPDKLGDAVRLAPAAAGTGETLYTVLAGDTLGSIAQAHYGSSAQYKAIFERNADRLKNANTIYEGQVIVLPAK